MSRLQESDGGHLRPWPWLAAVAVALVTMASVGVLMTSRLQGLSASPTCLLYGLG